MNKNALMGMDDLGERSAENSNMINFHGKIVPPPPKSIPPPIPGMMVK